MSDDGVIIDSFALAGYRSFGEEIQRFESFSKINLFIGQNNCGKSNILKFVHEVFPEVIKGKGIALSELDKHKPSETNFIFGVSKGFGFDDDDSFLIRDQEYSLKINRFWKENNDFVFKLFSKKSYLDGTPHKIWFDFNANLAVLENESWEKAFDDVPSFALKKINKDIHYSAVNTIVPYGVILRQMLPDLNTCTYNVEIIPAIRKVGKKGSVSDEFSGEGIIERLNKLESPNALCQEDRKKFDKINEFLRNVTNNSSATINIPHEKDTILVNMDEKTLPLESLGTGIHEVIILASAATILENTVICMEEPELHLNPILQKKLVRYLDEATNNQYFVTTHSAALMDTPNAEIYHINLEAGESKVRRVTSDNHKSEVCEDLGYHPSDLLQSNCIIWVEGPSDRIYLNYWINEFSSNLIEGIHYSIMFYGGRLASHLSGQDLDEAIEEDFVSLRRMNRRSVIVIDSDRNKKGSRINATKSRLKKEFDDGSGYAWITDGREMENYLPADYLKEAIKKIHPSVTITSKLDKYDNCLSIKTRSNKKSQASKVKVAKYITDNRRVDWTIHDLKSQIKRMVTFIEDSNPGIHVEEIL